MNLLDLPPDEPTTAEDLRARTRRVRALRREMRRTGKVAIVEPPVLPVPPPPPSPAPPAPSVLPWLSLQSVQTEHTMPIEEIPNFLAFRHNGSAVSREPSERIIRMTEIMFETAKYFGIGFNDILVKHRSKVIVNARHVAIYLSKKLTPYSKVQIGRKFGGLDHTSVLHALRRIQAMIDSQDRTIAEAILIIERKVLE